MHEASPLNLVAEFHKVFRHPIEPIPLIPSRGRCNLRLALLIEEIQELKESIENEDIVEIADALCDIQYVLAGAILEFGLGDKFKLLFDEVHRSNMSKACMSEEEAYETIQYYKNSSQVDSYYKKEESLYLVFREGDNKTLKSINYSQANLQSIL